MILTSSFITLNHLRFHAYHGVEAQERLTGNDYEVTIRIGYDISRAANTDLVVDTINYADVYGEVKEVMIHPSRLLENVVKRIADRLFTLWPAITSVDITVCKLNPPIGADCSGAAVEGHYISGKT